jgi:signal transduction histidine kinase
MVSVEPEAIRPARVARAVWADVTSGRQLEVEESGRHLVIGDHAALEQVLAILLDNANRYAPTGTIRVRIESADSLPGLTRIAVEDEGPGVAPTERERIFRRFVRGSSSGGKEGLGLGLGVARGLARAMGGDLRYAPGEAGGSAFLLTLPAAPEPDSGDGQTEGAAATGTPSNARVSP